MSRFNVTLAVAASTAAFVMEGCKSSAEKEIANLYSKYEKDMNKVTKTDKHTFDKCDEVEKNLQTALEAEQKKQAEKAKSKKEQKEPSAEDIKKANKKDDKYEDYLKTCKTSTGKDDEDAAEVQACVALQIAAAKAKDNKDLKKVADNQLKYVQEYANCYITSDPSEADFTDASKDLVKTYAAGFTFKVSDDKKSVEVKAKEVKA